METSGGAEERDRADLLADDVEPLGDASAAGAPPPKTESATLETTLKEGALDAGAGGSCCDAPSRPMLAVGNRLESAPVEMPPSLALTTARHGLVRWGTLACDLSVFIHFARTRGVVRTCCSENQTSRTQRARPLRSRARTGHHQKHRPPMAVPVDARAASGMGLGLLARRTLATPWAQAPPFSHRRRSFRPRRTRT